MSKGLDFTGHPWAGDGKLVTLLADQYPTLALASFPRCCLQALCVQSRHRK